MSETTTRPLIVAIDDSPVVLRFITRAVSEMYDCKTATSGEEGLLLIANENPELILLDVEMPDMSGFDTIKILKQNPATVNIPVIFLTGKNDVEFELEALKLGAVDYINKPFATPLLLKRVEMQMRLAQNQRELKHYNDNLQHMVAEKTEIIKELQYAIVFTLADLVEMRDGSTGGHVLRTQTYFKLMLEYLAANDILQDELRGIEPALLLEASQLHDIGKVAIPDAILLKPGRLTPEEFEIMKTHVVIGNKAIKNAMELTRDKEFLNFAAIVALTHHEKWDGTGYIGGLKGKEIPIAGRIMALVDVYDALVSERHYKKAMPHEKAIAIIVDGRGSHFDPELVDAFLAINESFDAIHQQYRDPRPEELQPNTEALR